MNIIIADDHQMVQDGYKLILTDIVSNCITVSSCEAFYNCLNSTSEEIHVAIIDYNMPSYRDQNLNTGADCCAYIKKLHPKCVVVLITAHEEAIVLYNIYRKVRPEALIVKFDFESKIFIDILKSSKYSFPYLSPIAEKSIKKIISHNSLLDSKNREIIMYLSQGFKLNQLENFVMLSTSTIQKRISKMLNEFEVKDYQELIVIARKHNLL